MADVISVLSTIIPFAQVMLIRNHYELSQGDNGQKLGNDVTWFQLDFHKSGHISLSKADRVIAANHENIFGVMGHFGGERERFGVLKFLIKR